jgi:VWFA-related protein
MRRATVALLLLAATLVGAASAAAASAPLQIRHVDFGAFPLVRVTAVAPAGVQPRLLENGRGAAFRGSRQLGSAEALVLAIDKSSSMRGAPLREAKTAAQEFLAGDERAVELGLVAFGNEALALTRQGETKNDVVRTLRQLAADPQTGTALYDAVVSAVARLQQMSTGTRILVLLTDGHDLGSHASLRQAIAAAQRASVVVYPIAAGRRADKQTLSALAAETGGRLFDTNDASRLGAIYAALGRELDRTWQISYLTRARPGD